MKNRPPRWTEAVVSFFVPPVCREHVLGDLCERYCSPKRYLWDAARTVPFVVASQIRRTSKLILVAVELFALVVGFRLAWLLAGSRVANEGMSFQSLAVILASGLLSLLLVDAYVDPQRRTRRGPLLDAGVIVAFICLVQLGLGSVGSDLALSNDELLVGSALSLMILARFRYQAELGQQGPVQAALSSGIPLSPPALRQRTLEFQKRIRWRNRIEYVAVGVVAFASGRAAWIQQNTVMTIAYGLFLAAVIYVAYRLHTKGSARSVPEQLPLESYLTFHSRELQRQIELMTNVWKWVLLPMLPGIVAIWLGILIRDGGLSLRPPITFLVLFGLVWKLNQHAAAKLERERQFLVGFAKDEEQ